MILALSFALGLTLCAKATRTVDWSGAVTGGVFAFVLQQAFGWPGVGQLMAFFALGTASSKVGYHLKHQAGTAQSIRTWRNAVANAGVSVLAALAWLALHWSSAAAVTVAGFSAAASDTVSGEIGRVYGRHPRMITTFRPARTGENGAVTLIGTLTGVVIAFLMSWIGYATHMLHDWKSLLVVGLAGIVGNLVDSLLGATLERSGHLDNEAVNFLCTLSAAVVALAGLAVC